MKVGQADVGKFLLPQADNGFYVGLPAAISTAVDDGDENCALPTNPHKTASYVPVQSGKPSCCRVSQINLVLLR